MLAYKVALYVFSKVERRAMPRIYKCPKCKGTRFRITKAYVHEWYEESGEYTSDSRIICDVEDSEEIACDNCNYELTPKQRQAYYGESDLPTKVKL